MQLTGYHCPMGCGQTLQARQGAIVCTNEQCPIPDAVGRLLGASGSFSTDHEVQIDQEGFTILHPLRERLQDELFECPVRKFLEGLSEPPVETGRYLVDDSMKHWAKIGSGAAQ